MSTTTAVKVGEEGRQGGRRMRKERGRQASEARPYRKQMKTF